MAASPSKLQQLPPRAASHSSSRVGSIVPGSSNANLVSSTGPRVSNLRTTSSLSQKDANASNPSLLSASAINTNAFAKRALTPTFNNTVTTVLYNADLEASSEQHPFSTSLNHQLQQQLSGSQQQHPSGGNAAIAATTVSSTGLQTTRNQLFTNSTLAANNSVANINTVMPIVPSSAPSNSNGMSGSPFRGIGGLFSGRGSPSTAVKINAKGPARLAAISSSPLSPPSALDAYNHANASSVNPTASASPKSVIQGLMSTPNPYFTVTPRVGESHNYVAEPNTTVNSPARSGGLRLMAKGNQEAVTSADPMSSLSARAEEVASALGRDLLLLQQFMDVKLTTIVAGGGRSTTPTAKGGNGNTSSASPSPPSPPRSVSPTSAQQQLLQNTLESRQLEQALIELRNQTNQARHSTNANSNKGTSDQASTSQQVLLSQLNRIVTVTELFQAKSRQMLEMMPASSRNSLLRMPMDSPLASPFLALAQAALTPADEAASPTNLFTVARSASSIAGHTGLLATLNGGIGTSAESFSTAGALYPPEISGGVAGVVGIVPSFLPNHTTHHMHSTANSGVALGAASGALSQTNSFLNGSGKLSPKFGGTTNTQTAMAESDDTLDTYTEGPYSPHGTANGAITPPMGSKRGSVLSAVGGAGKDQANNAQRDQHHPLASKHSSSVANLKGVMKGSTPLGGSKQGARAAIATPTDQNSSPLSSAYGHFRQKRLSAAAQKFLLENGFITLPPVAIAPAVVETPTPVLQPSSQKGNRNRTSSIGATGNNASSSSPVSTPAVGAARQHHGQQGASLHPPTSPPPPAAPAIDSFGNFGLLIDDLGDVNAVFERMAESISNLKDQRHKLEKRTHMEKAKYSQKEGQLALEQESMVSRLATAEAEAAQCREALADAKQILASLAAKEAGRSLSPNTAQLSGSTASNAQRRLSNSPQRRGKRESGSTASTGNPTPNLAPMAITSSSTPPQSRIGGGIMKKAKPSTLIHESTAGPLLMSDSLLPTVPSSHLSSTPPPAPSSRGGTAGGLTTANGQPLQNEFGALDDGDHRTYQRHIKLLEQRLSVSEGQLATWKAEVRGDANKLTATLKRVADLEAEVGKLNRRLSVEMNEHDIAKKQIGDIMHMRNEEAKMCSVAVRHLEERLAESKGDNDRLQLKLDLLSNNFRRLFLDWVDTDCKADSLTKELEAFVKELSVFRGLYNPCMVIHLEALQERYLQNLHQLDESQGTVASLRQDIDHVNLQRKLALNDTKEFVERIKGCAEWKLMLARLPEEAGQLDQRMLHLCADRDRRIVDISAQLQIKSAEFIAKVKAETQERRQFRDDEYRESNTYWQEHDCPEMRRVSSDAFAASFYNDCPLASTDLGELAQFSKAQIDALVSFKNIKHPSVPGSTASLNRTPLNGSPKPQGAQQQQQQQQFNTFRPLGANDSALRGSAVGGARKVIGGGANYASGGRPTGASQSGLALSSSKSSANLEMVADPEVIDAFIVAAMGKDITFKEFVKEQAAAKAMA